MYTLKFECASQHAANPMLRNILKSCQSEARLNLVENWLTGGRYVFQFMEFKYAPR